MTKTTYTKWIISVISVIACVLLAGTIQIVPHLYAQESVQENHTDHDHSAENSEHTDHDDHTGHDHGTKQDSHAGHDHDDHEKADAHAGHDHEHDDGIVLTDAQLRQMNVATAIAAAGTVTMHVNLPGEIRLNEDRMAHIVPRISGVVKEVRVHLGDKVRAGQILALIESRELAIAKAQYLAAQSRLSLADKVLVREKKLYQAKVSAEADYLIARQQQAQRTIEVSVALQKLLALGLTKKKVINLPKQSQENLRIYALTAPYNGTIIKKHLVQGELVSDQRTVYVLADLNTVWIDLNAYQKDVPVLRKGQQVIISGDGLIPAEAVITYVASVVREDLRTLLVRAVLSNPNDRYRPGLFINGQVRVDDRIAKIAVPAEAILNVDGKDSVFIQQGKGFKAVHVKMGRSNGQFVEVLSGLEPGDRYAAQGSFALKAVKVTSSLKGHAGHGH